MLRPQNCLPTSDPAPPPSPWDGAGRGNSRTAEPTAVVTCHVYMFVASFEHLSKWPVGCYGLTPRFINNPVSTLSASPDSYGQLFLSGASVLARPCLVTGRKGHGSDGPAGRRTERPLYGLTEQSNSGYLVATIYSVRHGL